MNAEATVHAGKLRDREGVAIVLCRVIRIAGHPLNVGTLACQVPTARKARRNGLKSDFQQIPMAKNSSPPLPTPPASYEAALEELETLVARLESGQLPLDQLLTGYQRGAELLKFCRDRLEAVENQIKVLEGNQLKPWNKESSLD